mgnify:CR=1 FL=1
MPKEPTPSLEDILNHKRAALAQREAMVPLNAVRAQARMQVRPMDMVSCLRDGNLSLVAQLERATPEGGRLLQDYDPVGLARLFEHNGAAAIAVVTEERYYGGGMDHLTLVKRAVNVPVWCADFIIAPYQVYQARAAGADGVQFIAYLLDDGLLLDLMSLAQRLKMASMVMVRDEAEVARVFPLDPPVIGLATRDPVTGAVNLDLPARLRPLLPRHTTVLAVGGFRTAEDVAKAAAAGLDGVVVARALLTAPDKAAKLRELFSFPESAKATIPEYRTPSRGP